MWFELDPGLVPQALGLRQMAEADLPFLRAVYRSVRDPELAQTPWTDAQKQAFCDSQFALQDRHYRAHYPGALFLVIEHAGQPVGRLYLGIAPGPLRLMDLAFLPQWRGRGWGTALVRAVVDRADREGRDTLLFVESTNPAHRLYEREGFVDEGVEGVYMRMRRKSTPCSRAAPVGA